MFVVDDKKETTMEYGFYYKAGFYLPFSGDMRTVRVWLPEDYDFDDQAKRFPVIYFRTGRTSLTAI